MRHLTIIIFATFILAGCKSQKQLQSGKSVATDSLIHSEHHRTIAVIDSITRSTSFDFDTLEVTVERPAANVDAPEIFRLKAVKGRVIDRQRVQKNQVEAYNRLDTVRYRQSAVEASTEHTATTRLYNPPDGTAAVLVTIIVTGILIYVFYRKR